MDEGSADQDPELLRRLLRAKDRMDRASHEHWPVRRLARVSDVSEAHFVPRRLRPDARARCGVHAGTHRPLRYGRRGLSRSLGKRMEDDSSPPLMRNHPDDIAGTIASIACAP